MPPITQHNKAQSGNVLFLVLIAVALFGALTYAMTQSSRTTETGVGTEQANIMASEMLAFTAEANAKYQRMLISQRLKPETIEYSQSLTGTRNAACGNNACRLFHPEGGGVINRTAPAKATRDPSSFGSQKYSFIIGAIQDVGTSLPEILIMISNINHDVCLAINKKMGINTIPTAIDIGSTGDYYNLNSGTWATPGVMPSATAIIGEEAGGTAVRGKHAFCFCDSNPCDPDITDESPRFLSVLQER